MDVNDMRGKTKPIASAFSIDLSSTSELSFYNGYEDISFSDSMKEELCYKMFENLFSHPESPLFDKNLEEGLAISGEGIKSLFFNLFFEYKEYLPINPYEVIDYVRDAIESEDKERWPKELLLDEVKKARIKNFYDKIIKNGIDLSETDAFTLDNLENMIRWLLLTPPKLIQAYLRSQESKENIVKFEKNIEKWYAGHESIKKQAGFHSKESRKTIFANAIGNYFGASLASSKSKDNLADFLIDAGILDMSHLAIIPSSYLNDASSWILFPETFMMHNKEYTKDNAIDHLGRNDTVPLSGSLNTSGKNNKKLTDDLAKSMKKTQHFLELRRSKIVPTTEFTELLSRFKYGVACKENIEIAHFSLNDLLISKGSNPRDESNKRLPSEAPTFTRADVELRKMSMARNMFGEEPLSLTVLRHCLAGKLDKSMTIKEEITKHIYLKNFNNSKYIEFIKGDQEPEFDQYTPKS